MGDLLPDFHYIPNITHVKRFPHEHLEVVDEVILYVVVMQAFLDVIPDDYLVRTEAWFKKFIPFFH